MQAAEKPAAPRQHSLPDISRGAPLVLRFEMLIRDPRARKKLPGKNRGRRGDKAEHPNAAAWKLADSSGCQDGASAFAAAALLSAGCSVVLAIGLESAKMIE